MGRKDNTKHSSTARIALARVQAMKKGAIMSATTDTSQNKVSVETKKHCKALVDNLVKDIRRIKGGYKNLKDVFHDIEKELEGE